MKAIILNSGTGSRMGIFTKDNHKSMVEIKDGVTLIEHQILTLKKTGIKDIIITTGYLEHKLKDYVNINFSDLDIEFVYNSKYLSTNYIYSIYLALDVLEEDIILLHGDLYFDEETLNNIINSRESCVVVDSTLTLPEKDFKAEIENGSVNKIATYISEDNCIACQPLYKFRIKDWKVFDNAIREFYYDGQTNVYAEEALNTVLKKIYLKPIDLKGRLCMEIDTLDDLAILKGKLIGR